MSLRLALVLDGNATGAAAATEQTAAGLRKVDAAATSTATKVGMSAREMDQLTASVDRAVAAATKHRAALASIEQARAVGAISGSRAVELTVAETAAYNAQINALERLGTQRKNAAQVFVDQQTITPNRAADIEAYGREMDALRARYNPLFALEQRRTTALAEIDRAHRVGAISAREMANAIKLQEAAFAQQVAAINGATAALQNNRAAAAKGVTNYNSANIAAQLQDIAVTSAMGMSPLQIALQQGTQMSAVFGNMGAAGAVKTLGAALMATVSPVSLVTIGLVAAASAGIQAFAAIGSQAEDANKDLDDHVEKIEEIARGYDSAIDAAKNYIEEARRAPQGAVASNLGKEREAALKAYGLALAEVQKQQRLFQENDVNLMAQAGGDAALVAGMQAVLDSVKAAGLSAETTRAQFDQLVTSLTLVANDSGADANLRAIAAGMLEVVEKARNASIEVGSLDASLRAIPTDVKIRLQMSTSFGDAISEINKLYMDPRSQFDQRREQLDAWAIQAKNGAQTYGELVGFANDYKRVAESIDAAEAAADAKTAARAAKQISDYDRQIKTIQERAQAAAMENVVIGQSTFVIEKSRVALELENAARKDSIGLTPERIAQINAESHAYALAAARQEQLQKAQAAFQETVNFGRSTLAGFFSDLRRGTEDGALGWDDLGEAGANALDKITDRALSMMANGIFDIIFNSVVGGLTGGFGGGMGGGLRPGYQAGVLHTGGSVANPPMARNVPAALFDNAPRLHTGGQLGPRERPIIALEGEEVGFPEQFARKYGGGMIYAPSNTFNIGRNAGVTGAELERLLDARDRRIYEGLPVALSEARLRAVRGSDN